MKPAKALFSEVVDYLKPPPVLSLSEWVVANRYFSAEESSTPGPYNPNFAPFQIGIMDAITNPDNEKIVVMASTRIGKTLIVTNVIGYYADLDPAPILYMRPRDEDVKNFSKQELNWLFANTLSLQDKLATNLGKESSNTLNLKQFPGGSIKLIGSNSPAGLSGYAARIVLIDEMDRMDPIPGFGNPVELAEGRTTTFPHNKKICYISSPTISHTASSKKKTIHSIYLESTQALFNIPCPHCGTFQPLEWGNLRFGHCRVKLDDVYYECFNCGGHIKEAQKKIAIRSGKWVDQYPEKAIKGFNISQLYSPFSSFENIAREWLLVDKSKDIYSIMRFKNEVLGLPFEEDLGLYKDSSDVLYNRRERYNLVPMPALLLTCAVDTQDSWLDYTVAAWGMERECWIIKSGRIEGDPAMPGPWDALTQVLTKDFKHESGINMRIEKVLIDTGGHKTQHVNKYLKGKGPLVQGIYGSSAIGKPIITKAKRDTKTGLRKWEIGVNNAKTDIFQMLSTEKPGALYIHFPFELEEEYFKELYSEIKIGGLFKQVGSRRNEKLDELGYSLAAYYICEKNCSMEKRKAIMDGVIKDMKVPEEIEEEVEPQEAPSSPFDADLPTQAAPSPVLAAIQLEKPKRKQYIPGRSQVITPYRF